MPTSKKPASNAGKVLKNGKEESIAKVKSAAGAALAQAKAKKKQLKNK